MFILCVPQVITSGIKTGSVCPQVEGMLVRRKRDDKHTDTDTHAKYFFNPGSSMLFDEDDGSAWTVSSTSTSSTVTATHGSLVLVHDTRFTPARGAWYHCDHIKKYQDGRMTLIVPVKRVGCCRFKCSDKSDYEPLKNMLKTALRGKMDYEQVIAAAAAGNPIKIAPEVMKNLIALRRELISRFHDTVRDRCNLDAFSPCGAAALNPGNNKDMMLFMLHLTHLIMTVGKDAMNKIWPITFDEDTYTRARKLIRYTNTHTNTHVYINTQH